MVLLSLVSLNAVSFQERAVPSAGKTNVVVVSSEILF